MEAVGYEYVDEQSIHPDLICSICCSPFDNPCCTPCDETFCRYCITQWLQKQNTVCPFCRQSLSIDVLTEPCRLVRNMIDQLHVKCLACGQTDLLKGNFNDHLEKVCPKTIVRCSSSTTSQCSWKGPREQLKQHINGCSFIQNKSEINTSTSGVS